MEYRSLLQAAAIRTWFPLFPLKWDCITSCSHLIWWSPTCHSGCCIAALLSVSLCPCMCWTGKNLGHPRHFEVFFFFLSRLSICSCCASLSFSCFSPSQAFFPFSLPCSLIHLNHILSPRSYLASEVFFLCCFLTAVSVCLPAPVRFPLPISVLLTFCVADKAI